MGVWNYCSGVPYATHFIANVAFKDGDAPPVTKIFAIPRAQFSILDDWGGEATLGMRASGSNSVKIEKIFVPEHWVVNAKPALWANEPIGDGTPGTKLHGNPLYLGRMIAPYHMSLVIPVIGAARAALDEYEEKVFTRPTYHPPIMPRVQHYDSQRPFGYAMTLTDSAEALLFDCAEKHMAMYRPLATRRHADDAGRANSSVRRCANRWPNGGGSRRTAVSQCQFSDRQAGQPAGTLLPRRCDVSRSYVGAIHEHGVRYCPRAHRAAARLGRIMKLHAASLATRLSLRAKRSNPGQVSVPDRDCFVAFGSSQ